MALSAATRELVGETNFHAEAGTRSRVPQVHHIVTEFRSGSSKPKVKTRPVSSFNVEDLIPERVKETKATLEVRAATKIHGIVRKDGMSYIAGPCSYIMETPIGIVKVEVDPQHWKQASLDNTDLLRSVRVANESARRAKHGEETKPCVVDVHSLQESGRHKSKKFYKLNYFGPHGRPNMSLLSLAGNPLPDMAPVLRDRGPRDRRRANIERYVAEPAKELLPCVMLPQERAKSQTSIESFARK